MKNKNVKKYIKLGFFAIIFIGIYIAFALLVGNSNKVNSNNFLIINSSIIWHEKGGKWYQESEFKENFGNHKFIGYNNMDEFTATNVQYNKFKWYLFDDNYNQVSNDDFRLAYSGNIKVKPVNYIISSYSASDDIVLDNNIKYENQKAEKKIKGSLTKYLYDFDGDGKMEALYLTSTFSLIAEDYKSYSYLFYVKDGKVLDKKVDSATSYGITDIIDINEDNKYEIIVNRNVLDNPTLDACYQIYNIENNKITLVQNCLYNK